MKAFLFHFSLLELQKPTLAGPWKRAHQFHQNTIDCITKRGRGTVYSTTKCWLTIISRGISQVLQTVKLVEGEGQSAVLAHQYHHNLQTFVITVELEEEEDNLQ